MKRNSFIFYFDWAKVASVLPEEKRVVFYDALIAHAQGKPYNIEDDVMLKALVLSATMQIDRDQQSYNEKCEKNRANAYERKRPQATATDGKRPQATATDNDNDNDNDDGNGNDNHNHNDNNKDKGSNKESDGVSDETPAPESKPRKVFVKPTSAEVEAYSQEQGYWIDGHHFCDYYESNGWKVGRNAMKDWKATVRTWIKRERENQNSYASNRGNHKGPTADEMRAAIAAGLSGNGMPF